MNAWVKQKRTGFTIVELLIVIVVIAILAAITIVAYNGIQNRAKDASVQTELASAAKKIEVYKSQNADAYPPSLAVADVRSSSNTLNYVYNATNNAYCLSSSNANIQYFISNVTQQSRPGTCTVADIPLAWWKFNGDLTDSGSANATLTNNGATLTMGQSNQADTAYLFNGTSQRMTPGANSVFNTTDGYTISAWVKPDSNLGTLTWRFIMAGPSADWGFGLNINASGAAYLRMTKVNASDANVSPVEVTKDAWHHVAMTYKDTNVTYYLDGRQVGSYIYNPAGGFTPGTKYIGVNANGGGYFKGSLDDVRVYGRAITADEAVVLFSAGAS